MFSNTRKSIVDSFDIGEVLFKAGNEIRLRPGFESVRHSNFRAKIDPMLTCNYTLSDLRGIAGTAPFIEPLGVEKTVIESGNVKMYPNPTTGRVNWETTNTKVSTIFVFDMRGNLLKEIKTSGMGNGNIEMEGMAAGLYFIRFDFGNNYKTLRIIKQ